MTNQQRAIDAIGQDADILVTALPEGLRKPLSKASACAFVHHQLQAIGIGIEQNPITGHHDLTGNFQDSAGRPLSLSVQMAETSWTLLEALPSDAEYSTAKTGATSIIGLHCLVTAIADKRAAPDDAQQALDAYRDRMVGEATTKIPALALAVLEKIMSHGKAKKLGAGKQITPGL